MSRTLLLLCLTSLLTDVGSEMVYPLLPFFVTGSLGASAAVLGLIEGVVEGLASVLKVYAGAISDHVGKRKPLALAGYGSSAAGKAVLALATSWPLAFLGRTIDRIGKGVRGAPRDAMLAESVPPDKRGYAFGLHRAFDNLGAAMGVVLAMFLTTQLSGEADGGIKSILRISLVPAALAILVLMLIREKGTAPAQKRPALRPLAAWRGLPGKLKRFLLVVFLFSLAGSSNMFLLLVASKRGHELPAVLVMYLSYNLVAALFATPAGRLSDLIGRRAVLVAGYAVYGLAYLGFAMIESPAACWWLFPAYGLYAALTEGAEKALIADLSPPEQKATMQGLHGTLTGVGLFFASLIAGIAWDRLGPTAPFYIGAGAGIAAAGFLAVVLRGSAAGGKA